MTWDLLVLFRTSYSHALHKSCQNILEILPYILLECYYNFSTYFSALWVGWFSVYVTAVCLSQTHLWIKKFMYIPFKNVKNLIEEFLQDVIERTNGPGMVLTGDSLKMATSMKLPSK